MKCNTSHSCEFCTARPLSVFNSLPADQLQQLNNAKSCMVFKKGQYVFAENSYPMGLYCINAGKIKLFITGHDGKEQILRFAKEGNIIGYRALLCDEPYHCSAIVIEDTSLCFIPKNTFLNLLEQNAQLSLSLIKLLGTNLKEAEQHIVSMSQKNVRERVAEALLFFKAVYGMESDQKTIQIKLSREEIADYVGTSTETAIRFLSELNSDKIIATEGKKIRILDLARLQRTAGIDF
ncbi:MAG: Crp/Fnr family transcriptional regulator [Sphingobacteriales bacterium]|nr:Crp/Fnr family transcriptional regulator [Sphingobacteriales bacterium]MCC7222369.1 Crp/Fnr family transcriptional regulator [Chitinophagales bacterium]